MAVVNEARMPFDSGDGFAMVGFCPCGGAFHPRLSVDHSPTTGELDSGRF